MVTKKEVTEALSGVMDPELGMSIVDLGLIYGIKVSGDTVNIKMTLTTPMCPLAPMMVEEARKSVSSLKGVKKVDIEMVWEPCWTPEMIKQKPKKP